MYETMQQRQTNRDECKPLRTLDELLFWKTNASDWSTLVRDILPRSAYCYAGKDLQCHKRISKPVKLLGSSVPKTLLCHDMKGGYLDDKFVYGSPYSYQYLFYHWSVVDVFVYFSHHFVTIPPLMWINAAHNHGVQILGTLITEHIEGFKTWENIFSHENVQNRVIDQLIAIQKHYKFDGYLINVENEINPAYLPLLKSFLKDLKLRMENGIVIWYDAVSFIDGKLKWQDELNEHNKPAFNVCDGIYLNYNWNPLKLEKSLLHAGVRLHDVYVGVDVFPRERKDAGGFNTNVALSLIREAGMSAAIFGFGWTHETQASDYRFFAVEKKFWAKLFPYLYIHCPNFVPFNTDFNLGFALNPEVTLLYDLSSQSFQPSLQFCFNEDDKHSCFHYSLDDSFNGGNCLLLNTFKEETQIHKLLLCDFPCSEASPLKFSISAKTIGEFHPFELLLSIENKLQNFTVILYFSDREEEKLLSETSKSDYSYCPALSEKINLEKNVLITTNLWITNVFLLKFNGVINEIDVLNIKVSTLIGNLSLE